MRLYLEIMEGEQKGLQFALTGGLTIGRRDSDVTLRDSKVSGNHARVEARPDGSLLLIDLGSSNGIKLNGKRLTEFELRPGTEFVIGRTLIRVMENEGDEPLMAEIVVEPEKPKTWRDHVAALAMRAIEEARPAARELRAFQPPVHLKFIGGIQTGTEWTLGYGPRDIGSASLDLVLEEVGLPGNCFHLVARDEGLLLKTEPGVHLKLNGRVVTQEILLEGDVIEIKNTQIAVAFQPETQEESSEQPPTDSEP